MENEVLAFKNLSRHTSAQMQKTLPNRAWLRLGFSMASSVLVSGHKARPLGQEASLKEEEVFKPEL